MKDRVRVLIVDDSAYSRQTIKGMLESDPDIEVVGTALNGIDAITKTMKLKPDIITLDFEMPEMDGFSFLRWLMKDMPTPVVMVTSYSDSTTVFKALELGAADFVAKPSRRASIELHGIRDDLVEKLKGIRDLKIDKINISRNLMRQSPEQPARAEEPVVVQDVSQQDIGVVAIGASTGGPTALQAIMTWLPGDFPAAVVISQHMPKGFTKPFAERLARLARIKVKEAADGDLVEEGKALICPGGHHMTLRMKHQELHVELKDSTSKDRYTPSADIMMASAAEHFGSAAMGVVLTGMGNDGKKGIVEIKAKGGYTIAEAESTAVVFGMPNEAIKTGRVDSVLPLYKIPEEIIRKVMGKREKKWKKNQE